MTGQGKPMLLDALFEAIDTGQLETFETLISQGADVNARNLFGMPPLVVTVSRQNEWVITELLKCGANPNCVCENPANRALLILSPDKRRLRSQPEENRIRWPGWTPLMEATRGRAHHLIKLLVLHGADPNQCTEKGYTALMEAASLGLASIANTLLENGAEVDARRVDGRTALHHAANRGYLDVMRELLSAGAAINASDKEGITPLMRAVRRSRDAALVLLRQGADASTGTKNLESALSWAAAAGDAEMLTLLLDYTGEAFMFSLYGETVIKQAEKSSCLEVQQITRPYQKNWKGNPRFTTPSSHHRR